MTSYNANEFNNILTTTEWDNKEEVIRLKSLINWYKGKEKELALQSVELELSYLKRYDVLKFIINE